MKMKFILVVTINLLVVSFAFAVNPPNKTYLVEVVNVMNKRLVKVWRFDASPGVAYPITDSDQILSPNESIMKSVVIEDQNDIKVFVLTTGKKLHLISGNQVGTLPESIEDIAEYEDGVFAIPSNDSSVIRVRTNGSKDSVFDSHHAFSDASVKSLFNGGLGEFTKIAVAGENEIVLITAHGWIFRISMDFSIPRNNKIQGFQSLNLSYRFSTHPNLQGLSLMNIDNLISGSDYFWLQVTFNNQTAAKAIGSMSVQEHYQIGMSQAGSLDAVNLRNYLNYRMLDASKSGGKLYVSCNTGNYCTHDFNSTGFVVEKNKVFDRNNLYSLGLTFPMLSDLSIDYPKHALDWYGRSKEVYNPLPFTGGMSPVTAPVQAYVAAPVAPINLSAPLKLQVETSAKKQDVKQEYGSGKIGTYLGLGENYRGVFQYESMTEKAEHMMREVFGVPAKQKEVKQDKEYFTHLIEKEIPRIHSMTRAEFAAAVDTTTNLKYFFKDLYQADPDGNDGALHRLGYQYAQFGIKVSDQYGSEPMIGPRIRDIAEALAAGQLVRDGKLKCEAELDRVAKSLVKKWIRL